VAKFDWGQRAVTATAHVAKVRIEGYYGKPPAKSYFNGCSTGGRMAGADGRPILAQSKVKLVEAAVNKACADQDGVVPDPRKRSFKPLSLKCQGNGADDCLTPAEVAVLQKWYGGAKNSKGEQLYPGGVPLCSEAYWPLWLTGLPTG